MVTIFRVIFFLFPLSGFSWNAKGHALITALALNKMAKTSQNGLSALNNTEMFGGKPQTLLEGSIWLDRLYLSRYRFLKKIHYIDIPFGQKKFYPKKRSRFNAITALYYAKHVLESRYANSLEKAFALRIYLHVIADIHQPLHTISYYSKQFPGGDRGGNRIKMKLFHRHMNLHQFWDDAGGYLSTHSIEQAFLELKDKPCIDDDLIFQPQKWAQQGFEIARTYAYFPPYRQSKMLRYQDQTQMLAKAQIQKAACRMAASLNHLYIQGLNTVG